MDAHLQFTSKHLSTPLSTWKWWGNLNYRFFYRTEHLINSDQCCESISSYWIIYGLTSYNCVSNINKNRQEFSPEIFLWNFQIIFFQIVALFAVLALAYAAPQNQADRDAVVTRYDSNNIGIDGFDFKWVILKKCHFSRNYSS